MSIKVECAAAGTAALPADAELVVVGKDADGEAIAKAFDDAAQRSIEQKGHVWISFE